MKKYPFVSDHGDNLFISFFDSFEILNNSFELPVFYRYNYLLFKIFRLRALTLIWNVETSSFPFQTWFCLVTHIRHMFPIVILMYLNSFYEYSYFMVHYQLLRESIIKSLPHKEIFRNVHPRKYNLMYSMTSASHILIVQRFFFSKEKNILPSHIRQPLENTLLVKYLKKGFWQ